MTCRQPTKEVDAISMRDFRFTILRPQHQRCVKLRTTWAGDKLRSWEMHLTHTNSHMISYIANAVSPKTESDSFGPEGSNNYSQLVCPGKSESAIFQPAGRSRSARPSRTTFLTIDSDLLSPHSSWCEKLEMWERLQLEMLQLAGTCIVRVQRQKPQSTFVTATGRRMIM